MLSVSLFIVLLILYIWLCRRRHSKCKCSKCRRHNKIQEVVFDDDSQRFMYRNLNDVEEAPDSRGIVPQQNQPDHVANRWKCDHSHPRVIDGGRYADTVFASDYPTPLRNFAVNQTIGAISDGHLLTRFGSVGS